MLERITAVEMDYAYQENCGQHEHSRQDEIMVVTPNARLLQI